MNIKLDVENSILSFNSEESCHLFYCTKEQLEKLGKEFWYAYGCIDWT